jgi:hypothetical protein
MFAMLAYTGNNPGATNNFDLTALTDANFSQRNGHYIFTEKYGILYVTAQSAGLTDARLVAPTYSALNADGQRIVGFNQAAGLGGVPTLFDKYTQKPLDVPINEEFQFQASKTAVGAQQQFGVLVLGTPGWNANIPAGVQSIQEATTASFTPAANVWSADQSLVFNANPRGGVYAVIGASLQQTADVLAFRINFPRTATYNNRKLLPGWIAQNAIGSFEDVITQVNRFHLGVWGYYHTFEPPQLEVLASTSAAMTPLLRLFTVYMGGDESLINSLYASMR